MPKGIKGFQKGQHYSPQTEFKKGQKAWNYKKIKRVCLICKKEFLISPSYVKFGRGKFCSRKCFSIYQKTLIGNKSALFGRKNPHSEEWRKKMKGRIPWNKGKKGVQVAWNKGKKLSSIHIENSRKSRIGKKQTIVHRLNNKKAQLGKHFLEGRNTPITPENCRIRNSIETRLWREVVFARDNWTCQKTKIKGGKLHPHHIKNFAQYPELRFAIDNGITFSEKAHKEFHKKYGRKNNNLEQIMEFIKL